MDTRFNADFEMNNQLPITINQIIPCFEEEEDEEEEVTEEWSESEVEEICPQCQAVFGAEQHLQEHLDQHCGVLICPKCGYKNIKEHLVKKSEDGDYRKDIGSEKECEGEEITESTRPVSPCTWCPEITLATTPLKQHLKEHGDQINENCTFCSYYSKDVEIHTEEKGPGEKVRIGGGLKIETGRCKLHLDSLLERAIYQCGLCGKSLKSDSHLTDHMAQHMAPNVGYCPYCTYTSSDPDHILHHVITHIQEQTQ